jgi:hypothetical protein
MKYDSEQLIRIGATESKFNCPVCHNPLVFKPLDGGIQLWCPNPIAVCPCIGTNEGGYGKTEEAANTILTQKISFGK